jgi:hypothetical protein
VGHPPQVQESPTGLIFISPSDTQLSTASHTQLTILQLATREPSSPCLSAVCNLHDAWPAVLLVINPDCREREMVPPPQPLSVPPTFLAAQQTGAPWHFQELKCWWYLNSSQLLPNVNL